MSGSAGGGGDVKAGNGRSINVSARICEGGLGDFGALGVDLNYFAISALTEACVWAFLKFELFFFGLMLGTSRAVASPGLEPMI